MVSDVRAVKLDPVAMRLAEAGDNESAPMQGWLEGQHQRSAMRRRAQFCLFSAWLMVSIAAVVSAVVAVYLTAELKQVFAPEITGEYRDSAGYIFYYSVNENASDMSSWSVKYMPSVLVVIAVAIVAGGPIAAITGWIPGFSRTVSAIDWSSTSEAMTRLLAVGCPYPEAFRTAAKVSHTNPSRQWLLNAADRVERGGEALVGASRQTPDAALLESLIGTANSEPHRQWSLAAEQFLDVARWRLVLLLQSLPIFSTLVSGLLIWIGISITLGWMWRMVAQMLRGFGVYL